MKKLLGVVLLLALTAASAFGSASPQRTVGLKWGTWTPQGFVTGADTTFLNGANLVGSVSMDTTDAFDLTWADWGAGGTDPNAGLPIMRLWVSGDFISCDSVKVGMQQSFDKQYWFQSSANATGGNVPQGNQQALSVPYIFTATPGFSVAPATVNLIAAPFARFIVTADGNTAARMAATQARVVYNDVRDNPNPVPQLTVKRVMFGTHTPQGFVSEKDSTSITFSALDTTEVFDLGQWSHGPLGIAPSVGDSLTAYGTLAGVYTDPSSNDSVYIQQQVGPDGIRFQGPKLSADNINGSFSGVTINTLPVDLTGASLAGFICNVGISYPTLGSSTSGLGFAPFARYTLRPGNGGQAMTNVRAWMSFWKIPRK